VHQSRRVFLRSLGAGVAFVALPEVSSIFNLSPGRRPKGDDLADTLRHLFFGEGARAGGPFVASAETTIVESDPQQLLSSPSALIGILDRIGVEKTFSTRVDYGEASQCRPHFESHVATWLARFGDAGVYTDVRRAPAERDVAVLVGGKLSPANSALHAAEGSVQFQHKPAIRLAGRDAGVTLKGPEVVGQHLRLSDKELVRALALIDKQTVQTDDGGAAYRYETPVSTVLHIDRPRENSRAGDRSVGVIAVRNKLEHLRPDNIYFADLYV
jgi:hypothetical protein